MRKEKTNCPTNYRIVHGVLKFQIFIHSSITFRCYCLCLFVLLSYLCACVFLFASFDICFYFLCHQRSNWNVVGTRNCLLDHLHLLFFQLYLFNFKVIDWIRDVMTFPFFVSTSLFRSATRKWHWECVCLFFSFSLRVRLMWMKYEKIDSFVPIVFRQWLASKREITWAHNWCENVQIDSDVGRNKRINE